MDLVDEQHVALVEIGEQRRQIAALAMTGPDVARNPTPISRATICASVVLPSPGGPKNSTWSSGSLRALAAAMKMRRFSRAALLPDEFVERLGPQRRIDIVRRALGGEEGRGCHGLATLSHRHGGASIAGRAARW